MLPDFETSGSCAQTLENRAAKASAPVKAAVFAPMVMVNVNRATAAAAGRLKNIRNARDKSWRKEFITTPLGKSAESPLVPASVWPPRGQTRPISFHIWCERLWALASRNRAVSWRGLLGLKERSYSTPQNRPVFITPKRTSFPLFRPEMRSSSPSG